MQELNSEGAKFQIKIRGMGWMYGKGSLVYVYLPFFNQSSSDDLLKPIWPLILDFKELTSVVKKGFQNLTVLKLACFRKFCRSCRALDCYHVKMISSCPHDLLLCQQTNCTFGMNTKERSSIHFKTKTFRATPRITVKTILSIISQCRLLIIHP